MLSFEEARKQRQKKVQSPGSPVSFEDARANRSEESKNRFRSYIRTPQDPTLNAISTDPESSATKAFGRSAAVNTLPMVGGLALGVKSAAVGAAVSGPFAPVGAVVGFIGGGIVGSIITKVAQDKVLEVTKGDEWKRNLDQSIAEDRQNHPFATLAGEAAPALIAFKPSPSTLKQAFNLSKRALTDPKSLGKHTQTLEGKVELDALMNVGIGAGIDISLETYQQAREGDFNALRIIASGVIGGTLSNPNRIGVKMGFKPTGDAVIEEYNKFGSKTEAADIITKGKIPMLNRGVDDVLQDRMELASILKGEREQSRFDNPRIVQAERISGTIDKDVTADSDINVYRLDGRSGPLRIGERVTANPFIADVYGGRVNPETTLKAGDLVRTSRGDYVYVPKGEIQARPKLPPVATTVEKTVRDQIKGREGLQAKERQSKGKEAMRIKEEPARLAKEARDKAEAQQKASDALVAKQEAAAVKQTADLETKVKTIQASGVAKVQAEANRVASENARVSKETAAVTKKLREDLDAARLDNVKRKATKTTPLQKAKEQIRFKNLNARIRAKAIADKKKLNTKTEDATKDIERQARKDVIEARSQGKLDKAEQVIKDKAEFDTLEVPVPVKKKAGEKPVSAIAKKAQKFSTFEDFIKAQGTPMFHGGAKTYNELKVGGGMDGKGVYLTKSNERAVMYGTTDAEGNKRTPAVTEAYADIKNPIIYTKEYTPEMFSQPEIKEIINSYGGSLDGQNLALRIKGQTNDNEKLVAYGFDGIQTYNDIIVFDPKNVKTTSQLRAEYQAAKAESKSEESKSEGARTESKAETKTTLIGTKRVQSESLIKNAVQDARDTSNKAQELDQDVTFQQGTTFVEQRKLSAELLAEKGFDESILFARQATDAELNKLGIARSALYEVLYKTVIREGQFDKYRDELESLALLVADEVSEAAQKSSIHRLATQNDPFRRVAALKKAILDKEKQVSGSLFTKEVDELYAKIKMAGTEDDINKIINDNLC